MEKKASDRIGHCKSNHARKKMKKKWRGKKTSDRIWECQSNHARKR
jgi:hypothetical protein